MGRRRAEKKPKNKKKNGRVWEKMILKFLIFYNIIFFFIIYIYYT